MNDEFENSKIGDTVETSDLPSARLIGLLIAVAALAIALIQNAERATVEFMWLRASTPLWVVIGLAALAGAALDRIVAWFGRRAKKRKATKQAL